MTVTTIRTINEALHVITAGRFIDGQEYDADEFIVSANSNGVHISMTINVAEAAALAEWLTDRLAATAACDVCNGTGGVLDPNHDDLPIACPECRTTAHGHEYNRREAVHA